MTRILRPTVLALAGALALGCAGARAGDAAAKKYEAPDERFVFFAMNRTDLQSDAYFSIGYVTALLDQNPGYHVLVVGHADQHVKSDANREMGFKRARAVRKALMDEGISAARILIACPREPSESTMSSLGRRADMFVHDPLQDEASNRVGYPVEIKNE
jgi:predicted methyltransferase